MASKRIQSHNKQRNATSGKQRLSNGEIYHQIAVMIEPQLEIWMSVAARMNTFQNEWPYDNVKKARCTSIAVRILKERLNYFHLYLVG